MNFPDLNDDGKVDAKDYYIYEEILKEKNKNGKKPEPSGCCVLFLALLLPALLVVDKLVF